MYIGWLWFVSLKMAKRKFEIEIEVCYCDVSDCLFSCEDEDDMEHHQMKQHKASIHSVGVSWYLCDIPGCFVKTKRASHLKLHKAFIHSIGVIWTYCDIPGCSFKTKQASNLKQHKADVHSIGVIWTYCDIPGCSYKTKKASNLKQHNADKHFIGVIWTYCDIPGCSYKTKKAGDLKRHKADKHSIGVNWQLCDILNCTFKTKQASNLKQHKADVHDIGEFVCEICEHHASKLTPYLDPVTQSTCSICRSCYRKATGYSTSREKQMVEALRADNRIGPYIVLEDRILQHDVCGTRCRPDVLLSCPGKLHILVECDEGEHKRHVPECEVDRMNQLMDEFQQGRILWVRWNPDTYKLPESVFQRPLRKERLQDLCELVVSLAQKSWTSCDPYIAVHYMFFSNDNPVIARCFAPQLHY